MTNHEPEGTQLRRHWMGVLAKSNPQALKQAWDQLEDTPDYECLRAPETGLTMVRARMGGTGKRFNFGEMTMTRCVVRLETGAMGYSYVAGHNSRQAELAAVFDALLQSPDLRPKLMDEVIAPLQQAIEEQKALVRAHTAPTKVDFFTLVRGED